MRRSTSTSARTSCTSTTTPRLSSICRCSPPNHTRKKDLRGEWRSLSCSNIRKKKLKYQRCINRQNALRKAAIARFEEEQPLDAFHKFCYADGNAAHATDAAAVLKVKKPSKEEEKKKQKKKNKKDKQAAEDDQGPSKKKHKKETRVLADEDDDEADVKTASDKNDSDEEEDDFFL